MTHVLNQHPCEEPLNARIKGGLNALLHWSRLGVGMVFGGCLLIGCAHNKTNGGSANAFEQAPQGIEPHPDARVTMPAGAVPLFYQWSFDTNTPPTSK